MKRWTKMIFGMGAAIGLAAGLSGCSSVAELPYPNLAHIIGVKGEGLSDAQRTEMVHELKVEQETHAAVAAKEIEQR